MRRLFRSPADRLMQEIKEGYLDLQSVLQETYDLAARVEQQWCPEDAYQDIGDRLRSLAHEQEQMGQEIYALIWRVEEAVAERYRQLARLAPQATLLGWLPKPEDMERWRDHYLEEVKSSIKLTDQHSTDPEEFAKIHARLEALEQTYDPDQATIGRLARDVAWAKGEMKSEQEMQPSRRQMVQLYEQIDDLREFEALAQGDAGEDLLRAVLLKLQDHRAGILAAIRPLEEQCLVLLRWQDEDSQLEALGEGGLAELGLKSRWGL